MPLYEGIHSLSLFTEKDTAIIFDFGIAYTKVGFAGETGPRAIVPSIIECPDTKKVVPVFQDQDPQILRHRLAAFVHKLYIRNLLVNAKERRVVVVENILSSTLIKDIIASVLFRHNEVISVSFVPSHLVSLLPLGISTALVIDIGYSEVSVIPVYEGVPILHAWQSLKLGTQAIQQSVKSLLLERGSVYGESGKEEKIDEDILTDELIEDIVVRCCFVSTPERSARLLLNREDRSNEPPPPPPEVMYPVSGALTIKIPGTVREMASEVLFETDADNLCLSSLIVDALVQCPIDTRKQLAGNLLMIGGGAMMLGMRKRILQEVRSLSSKDIYTKHFAPPTYMIHTPPVKENFVAWFGGSIMGITEGGVVPHSISRDQYLSACSSGTPLPDWCSLLHNDGARAPA